MAAPRGGTRDRLLDAAEELFATHGYEGTSTRDIAAKSSDTIGSVNYHFGSKDQLYIAVIERRYKELVEERTSMLANQAGAMAALTVEELVSHLALPYLRRAMHGEPGWKNYLRLMSHLIYSPKWYSEVLARLYDPASLEFMKSLRTVFPGANEKDLGYAYHFLLGCMIHCASDIASNRISVLTGGVCDASNFDEIQSRLVKFCSAGLRAVINK